MKTNKTLIISEPTNFYHGEKNCDKIRFLIPQTYEDIDLSECNVYLIYQSVNGSVAITQLEYESELYEDQLLQAIYVVNNDFTAYSGTINAHLRFEKDDVTLKSGKIAIAID